jgi:hypothetical protein
MRLRLRGLDPDAVYTLTDVDVPGTKDMTGKSLQDEGLSVAIKSQPGAAVIVYKKKS